MLSMRWRIKSPTTKHVKRLNAEAKVCTVVEVDRGETTDRRARAVGI